MNEPQYQRDDLDRREANIEAERERCERFSEASDLVKQTANEVFGEVSLHSTLTDVLLANEERA